MEKRTYSKPSDVVAEQGKVLVDGPDGVNVALTPEAARVTGTRLLEEGLKAEALQQQAEEGADRISPADEQSSEDLAKAPNRS